MSEVLVNRPGAVEFAALILGLDELIVVRGNAVECANVSSTLQHVRVSAVEANLKLPGIVCVAL